MNALNEKSGKRNVDKSSNILFQEEQRFRQPWLWLVITGSSILFIIVMGYIFYQQLIAGQPVGRKPVPDGILFWFAPAIVLIMLALPVLFCVMKLSVQVDNYFLHIRFFPFVKKYIPLDRIVKWGTRQYNPFTEYGGWGIRFSLKGKAYIVSGKRGVHVELTDGEKILIGSQRPKELALAIEKARFGNLFRDN